MVLCKGCFFFFGGGVNFLIIINLSWDLFVSWVPFGNFQFIYFHGKGKAKKFLQRVAFNCLLSLFLALFFFKYYFFSKCCCFPLKIKFIDFEVS